MELTAVAVTTAAAATAAAARTVFAGLGFVNREVTALEFRLVCGLDGGVAAVAHFHECEAAGAARFAVRDDLSAGDRPVLSEQIGQVVRRGTERQIADIQLLDQETP